MLMVISPFASTETTGGSARGWPEPAVCVNVVSRSELAGKASKNRLIVQLLGLVDEKSAFHKRPSWSPTYARSAMEAVSDGNATGWPEIGESSGAGITSFCRSASTTSVLALRK